MGVGRAAPGRSLLPLAAPRLPPGVERADVFSKLMKISDIVLNNPSHSIVLR
jgi:hypothetical protein